MDKEQLQEISLFGLNFVYLVSESRVFIDGKVFFVNLLDRLGYRRNEALMETGTGVEVRITEKTSRFLFSPTVIQENLLNYEISESKFKQNPNKYKTYVDFNNKGGLSALVEAIETKHNIVVDFEYVPIGLSHLQEIESEQQQEAKQLQELTNQIAILEKELEATKLDAQHSIEELSQSVVEGVKYGEELEFENSALKSELDDTKGELESTQKVLKSIEKEANEDRLGSFLQRNSVKTYLTIFVILTFLPFTIGALARYIPFQPSSDTQTYLFWALCFAIAVVWDSSILYFAKTGMQKMSRIGSIYQFLFFCAEFDLIATLFSDMLFLNGMYWQKLIVTLCIVSFSAVLVNQFTELSIKKDKQ